MAMWIPLQPQSNHTLVLSNWQNKEQFKKDFELVAQQWAKSVLFRSPKSWGLHCGPMQPVGCRVLLCPPRDMEPPNPPEDSPCGSTFPGATMHSIFLILSSVSCQVND